MAWHQTSFSDITKRLAAYQCWRSGQTLTRIATSARKNRGTVRRWVRDVGAWHGPIAETCPEVWKANKKDKKGCT